MIAGTYYRRTGASLLSLKLIPFLLADTVSFHSTSTTTRILRNPFNRNLKFVPPVIITDRRKL